MPASSSSSGMPEALSALTLNEEPSQKRSAVPVSLSTPLESEVVGPSAPATPSVAAFPSVPLEPGLQQDQQKTSHKPTEESAATAQRPIPETFAGVQRTNPQQPYSPPQDPPQPAGKQSNGQYISIRASNIQGLQIGDGNVMTITKRKKKKKSK
nr:PREDICTED: uncharacterized protein LOC106705654 [Latimeria chalumnae]|eukprot:XP_014350954.1 PREDICTED: uncharacterized protein LOC106705654 [Latimeria chalumnae]